MANKDYNTVVPSYCHHEYADTDEINVIQNHIFFLPEVTKGKLTSVIINFIHK